MKNASTLRVLLVILAVSVIILAAAVGVYVGVTLQHKAHPKNCAVDPQASEVLAAVDDVNARYPLEGYSPISWEYRGESNYSPCSELSYAIVGPAGHASPDYFTYLIFFHKGKYIGVDDTEHQQQAYEVTPDGEALAVQYIDYEEFHRSGEAAAYISRFTTPVRFYWDGDKVERQGRMPNQSLSR
ncbi:LppP/LprE family lipoprotein [Corynebacterium uropygiale]|uniref:LppP/LprE family lipoprotein n=1 Tax=Corynebacterium uropygiale TaxID=1775911 RepID=A0A9X1QQG4_9CORY|nr:LppP/LprE family lipoprotein [Corynebacterium uropygiale]MCF4006901.1 LppP/LprE family lipoprotein [Corynebacterium uropygiale]